MNDPIVFANNSLCFSILSLFPLNPMIYFSGYVCSSHSSVSILDSAVSSWIDITWSYRWLIVLYDSTLGGSPEIFSKILFGLGLIIAQNVHYVFFNLSIIFFLTWRKVMEVIRSGKDSFAIFILK